MKGRLHRPSEVHIHSDGTFDSVLRKIARIEEVGPGPALPRVGSIVDGKYRIEARLGRGGMGVVFRATHLVSQKAVAIKWMLRPTSDELAHLRFLREARAAGRIDHPNVVDVYDIGQVEHGAYLVMELLHGEPLRALLGRGPLPAADAVALLLPAMRGVSAAHRAGVIHRDLKPDNIFLCTGPDGESREAKVLDFGVSAVLGSTGTDPQLTSTGTLLGTPIYMSPEQFDAAARIDARADVYAFGVILYEALTGELPFAGTSFPGLAFAIVHQPPRSVRELRPEVPRPLERIVLRALSKRPEERPQSIDQLIDALVAYGQSARPERTPAHESGRRRRWLWLSLTAALTGALGLAGGLAIDRSIGASRSTLPPLAPEAPAASASPPAADMPIEALPTAEPVPVEAALGVLPPLPGSSTGASKAPVRSCEHARAAGRTSDGLVKIDADGSGPLRPFEVLCTGMAGGPAREYLPLARGDSAEDAALNATRFSYRGGACGCPDLTRRFTHVRLDPRTLAVDPTDGSFASYDRSLQCEAQQKSRCGESVNLSWGGAGSCRAPGDTSGSATIDLRHTPFALSPEARFVPAGFGAAGSAVISRDRKTVQLVGGGQCGSMVAEAATLPLVVAR